MGAEIALEQRSEGETVGQVMLLEREETEIGETKKTQLIYSAVHILTPQGGVRRVQLADVLSVRIVDPALRQKLAQALQVARLLHIWPTRHAHPPA